MADPNDFTILQADVERWLHLPNEQKRCLIYENTGRVTTPPLQPPAYGAIDGLGLYPDPYQQYMGPRTNNGAVLDPVSAPSTTSSSSSSFCTTSTHTSSSFTSARQSPSNSLDPAPSRPLILGWCPSPPPGPVPASLPAPAPCPLIRGWAPNPPPTSHPFPFPIDAPILPREPALALVPRRLPSLPPSASMAPAVPAATCAPPVSAKKRRRSTHYPKGTGSLLRGGNVDDYHQLPAGRHTQGMTTGRSSNVGTAKRGSRSIRGSAGERSGE